MELFTPAKGLEKTTGWLEIAETVLASQLKIHALHIFYIGAFNECQHASALIQMTPSLITSYEQQADYLLLKKKHGSLLGQGARRVVRTTGASLFPSAAPTPPQVRCRRMMSGRSNGELQGEFERAWKRAG